MTEVAFDVTRKIPTRQPVRQTVRVVLPYIAGATTTLLALGFGLHWWLSTRFIEITDNAYVRADAVTISPRISGYVAEVVIHDNQEVHRGDILVRIEDATYRARIQQAQAAVAASQADIAIETAAVATLDAQVAQQENLITQAQAEVQSADADASRAGLEWRRQQALAERQINSIQRFETTETDQKKTIAVLAGTRAALAGQRARLLALFAERQGKAAALDKARATLKQMQAAQATSAIDLENTAIRAPTDGVVGQRIVRVGQYVEPGSPLLAVVPLQTNYVVANYKETQLGRVAIGQPVDIEVDAFGGETLHGHVDSFAPASGAQFALLPPDNATGNFTKIVQRMPIRIEIDSDQPRAHDLRPGMSIVARINTRRSEASSHGQ